MVKRRQIHDLDQLKLWKLINVGLNGQDSVLDYIAHSPGLADGGESDLHGATVRTPYDSGRANEISLPSGSVMWK